MLLTALIAATSLLITLIRKELGLILIIVGVLFRFPAGRVTSEVGIIAGVFAAGILCHLRKRYNLPNSIIPLVLTLIGFLSLGWCSQLHSFQLLPPEVAQKSLISFKWFTYNFLILFATLFNLPSYKDFHRFMTLLGLLFLLLLTLAYLQLLSFKGIVPLEGHKYFLNEGMGYIYSVFSRGGPHVLIAFLLLTFPLILAHFFTWNRPLVYSITILTLLIFIATKARGGLLAQAIAIFLILLPAKFINKRFMKGYIFAVLAVLILTYVSTFVFFKGLKLKPDRIPGVATENNWEVYLINPDHRLQQKIFLDHPVSGGSLYMNLAGGKGKNYQLRVKVNGQVIYTFNKGLPVTAGWYRVPIPQTLVAGRDTIDVLLEITGQTDARDNFAIIYGGMAKEYKVKSAFFDGLKWDERDLSPKSGIQRGMYYIFFSPEKEIKPAIRPISITPSWGCTIADPRYRIRQYIPLSGKANQRNLYLEMVGGGGRGYGIKILAEGKLLKTYAALDEKPYWYQINLPEDLLQGKTGIEIELAGIGQLDTKTNWFQIKGSLLKTSNIRSSFYDGVSWQDYDLSPDKGLQGGVYHIFLGSSTGQEPICAEADRWNAVISNKDYRLRQYLPLTNIQTKAYLYLEMAGGQGKDYGVRVFADDTILQDFGPLSNEPHWYQIELPERIFAGKKKLLIEVQGIGRLDPQKNWFLVKGSCLDPGGTKGIKSSFFDGMSWQDYDLSPQEGLQSGAYHILLAGSYFGGITNQDAILTGWDMYLARPEYRVLQKIFLDNKEREENGKLFLLLSGGMGKKYSARILIDGQLIKEWPKGIDVHPQWYSISIPQRLLHKKPFINVEIEAQGKLDTQANWVKIYGSNNPPSRQVKSFMYDGNKWIDFDLSVREGIQGGAYHIYYETDPQTFSTYAIPEEAELFSSGNRIKQVFDLPQDQSGQYTHVILKLAGGSGKDYRVIIKANGVLIKEFKAGLPPKPRWVKLSLPESVYNNTHKIELELILERDKLADPVENRVVIGAGLAYPGKRTKSYIDLHGYFEPIGINPIPGQPAEIYQILLLSKDGKMTFPIQLSPAQLLLIKRYQTEGLRWLNWPGWRQIIPRLANYFIQRDQSSHDRLLMWILCLDIIRDHPLLGIGYNIFDKVYPTYYQRYMDLFPQVYTHPHNDYLAMGISFGLGAFILFPLWYILPLASALSLMISTEKKDWYYYGVALTCTYVSLIFLSLFYMNFSEQRFYATFWIIVGITYLLDRFSQETPQA
jgi:hypothetical protein